VVGCRRPSGAGFPARGAYVYDHAVKSSASAGVETACLLDAGPLHSLSRDMAVTCDGPHQVSKSWVKTHDPGERGMLALETIRIAGPVVPFVVVGR